MRLQLHDALLQPCLLRAGSRRDSQHGHPNPTTGYPAPLAYPVGVEELDGPQDVKLAGHEELDSHVPGERGHIVLARPLVDLLQELLGRLRERRGACKGDGRRSTRGASLVAAGATWSLVRGQGLSTAWQTQQLLGRKC